ncbi:MAG: trehalose synthase [Leadbetterella sp.]|nr:trehalose synthase [Leadbetterella sp.]
MSPFVLLLDWEGFEKDKYVHTVLEDNLLPNYLEKCSWFAGRNRRNWRIKITGAVRMKSEEAEFFFTYLQIRYSTGETESYLFPVSFVGEEVTDIPEGAFISRATLDEKEGFLVEAVYDPAFRLAIFRNLLSSASTPQKNDRVLEFERGKGLEEESDLESSFIEIDSNNTAFVYNQKYFFKLYRNLYQGINPEIQSLRFFSRTEKFKSYPKYCGSINLTEDGNPLYTFGVMTEYIAESKDNWSLTGDYLNDFITGLVDGNFQVREQVFVKVAQLGKRTAIMHDALFDLNSEEAFRPEQINRSYRTEVHRRLEDDLDKQYDSLIEIYMNLDEQTQSLAWQFMEAKDKILNFIDQILTRVFNSLRIRIHGDFHLRQILVNANGIHVIDFEGEPNSPISSRITKHSPLKDVASMIRSYHYAVSAKLYNSEQTQMIPEKDLLRASDRWYKLMRDTFLEEYLTYFGPHHTLLKNNGEVNYLLQFHLLEKAIHELGFEIRNRPSWIKIPLKGILDVVREIEKLRTV